MSLIPILDRQIQAHLLIPAHSGILFQIHTHRKGGEEREREEERERRERGTFTRSRGGHPDPMVH